MVGIVQLARAPDCGSGGRGFESHYPPHLVGCSQVVRHQTLTLAFRRFESCHPSHVIHDPLAQSAEHLPFKQGVPRSSRGWVTNIIRNLIFIKSLLREWRNWQTR